MATLAAARTASGLFRTDSESVNDAYVSCEILLEQKSPQGVWD